MLPTGTGLVVVDGRARYDVDLRATPPAVGVAPRTWTGWHWVTPLEGGGFVEAQAGGDDPLAAGVGAHADGKVTILRWSRGRELAVGGTVVALGRVGAETWVVVRHDLPRVFPVAALTGPGFVWTSDGGPLVPCDAMDVSVPGSAGALTAVLAVPDDGPVRARAFLGYATVAAVDAHGATIATPDAVVRVGPEEGPVLAAPSPGGRAQPVAVDGGPGVARVVWERSQPCRPAVPDCPTGGIAFSVYLPRAEGLVEVLRTPFTGLYESARAAALAGDHGLVLVGHGNDRRTVLADLRTGDVVVRPDEVGFEELVPVGDALVAAGAGGGLIAHPLRVFDLAGAVPPHVIRGDRLVPAPDPMAVLSPRAGAALSRYGPVARGATPPAHPVQQAHLALGDEVDRLFRPVPFEWRGAFAMPGGWVSVSTRGVVVERDGVVVTGTPLRPPGRWDCAAAWTPSIGSGIERLAVLPADRSRVDVEPAADGRIAVRSDDVVGHLQDGELVALTELPAATRILRVLPGGPGPVVAGELADGGLLARWSGGSWPVVLRAGQRVQDLEVARLIDLARSGDDLVVLVETGEGARAVVRLRPDGGATVLVRTGDAAPGAGAFGDLREVAAAGDRVAFTGAAGALGHTLDGVWLHTGSRVVEVAREAPAPPARARQVLPTFDQVALAQGDVFFASRERARTSGIVRWRDGTLLPWVGPDRRVGDRQPHEVHGGTLVVGGNGDVAVTLSLHEDMRGTFVLDHGGCEATLVAGEAERGSHVVGPEGVLLRPAAFAPDGSLLLVGTSSAGHPSSIWRAPR